MGKNNATGNVQVADISELHIDVDLQDFLEENGISKIPIDMASDIGSELMEYIRGSAERLAKILQEEESRLA